MTYQALFVYFCEPFVKTMHLSKEVRIGILVTAALVIFFTGFYFLKGTSLFSNDKEYYCFYANVDGLQNSANVQINGLNVGHVISTRLVGNKGVLVTVSIGKEVDLPNGTTANLASSDLLGTKIIKLVLGPGPGSIPTKSELKTIAEGGLVDNVSAQLTPRLQELKGTIIALDTVLASVNKIVGADNQKAMASAIDNIKLTSQNLEKLSSVLAKEGDQISGVIKNANSITGSLAKQNDTIKHILSNVNTITRQVANAPIQKAFADLQNATAQLQGIMNKINNNEGSLGMLINNKDVYNNLNNSLHSMSSLMDDLKAHPKKYINLHVFGGKDRSGGK